MPLLVVVVDDDDDVRSVVALALRIDGHHVEEAATVDGGIELIASCSPTLVITDMSFGTESGERVVGACQRAGCPVVVMTASVASDVLDPLTAAGVPVLIKPFPMDELTSRVREFES